LFWIARKIAKVLKDPERISSTFKPGDNSDRKTLSTTEIQVDVLSSAVANQLQWQGVP